MPITLSRVLNRYRDSHPLTVLLSNTLTCPSAPSCDSDPNRSRTLQPEHTPAHPHTRTPAHPFTSPSPSSALCGTSSSLSPRQCSR
ncbi:hypothetical protein DENSPDRAFT_586411 [Dentipellis sp. KUC8613]|nr:hypothetical protein DENSPDRAFT_586411 [Dentipellis sp. KUC8613]